MATRFEAASLRVAASEERIRQVLADPATSYWLKDAIRGAIRRDPVDAVVDAQLLFELLTNRVSAIIDELSEAIIAGD